MASLEGVKPGDELEPHRARGDEVMTAAREQLEQRIRVAMPEDSAKVLLDLLEQVVQDARRDQARVDGELMQRMSDRSPNTTPPKGGTNSKAVYASAANILHPEGLGWSLELPDHLKED